MRKIYTYGLVFCLVVLSACRGCNEKQLPSLKETYQQNDKKPFGGYVAFKEFEIIKEQTSINVLTGPFIDLWDIIQNEEGEDEKVNEEEEEEYEPAKNTVYFLITKNLLLDAYDINMLLSFADKGNDLFISADYIQPEFLEKIHCIVERRPEVQAEAIGKMDDSFVMDFDEDEEYQNKYGYYYYPFLNSIRFEKKSGTILGYNEMNQPNYIVLKYGKGQIYLHVAPRAFSNYFLMTGENLDYYKYVLSTLPFNPKYYIWDEYYKLPPKRREQQDSGKSNFSTFRVINNHPSLLRAFWVTVAAMLLFVLFNMKRKQRPIPQIPSNTNATVEFTETIGRLYLQHKDNKNIAEKQVTYFLEKIRNNYFINTSEINDEFLNSLAGKSGVELSGVKDLFGLIKKILAKETVTDDELLQLNDKITHFNKNRK